MSDSREFLTWRLEKDSKKIQEFFEKNKKDSGVCLGDSLEILKKVPSETFQTTITSPPYYALRDYGITGQIGLEETPEKYIESLTELFEEIRRTTRKDGTLWLNIGDTYAGNGGDRAPDKINPDKGLKKAPKRPDYLKQKDLIGIPWMLAFSLRKAGWYLRTDIIWEKNGQPESVTDRPTRNHEFIFLFSKSSKYYYDHRSLRGTNGGNLRSVWKVPMEKLAQEHIAAYPKGLVTPCLELSTKPGDLVLDPFSGSGTTGVASVHLGRRYFGCELNPEYIEISKRRFKNECRTGATLLKYLSKDIDMN